MKEQIQNSMINKDQLGANLGSGMAAHHNLSMDAKSLGASNGPIINSMSTVKLPHLNNRSIVNTDHSLGDLTHVEVYNPYENRQS